MPATVVAKQNSNNKKRKINEVSNVQNSKLNKSVDNLKARQVRDKSAGGKDQHQKSGAQGNKKRNEGAAEERDDQEVVIEAGDAGSEMQAIQGGLFSLYGKCDCSKSN